MKKKYIITFLFLLFLNINTTYAAEEYVFEVSKFGENYNNFEDFMNTICSVDGANCRKYLDKTNTTGGATSSGKDAADQTTGANKTKYNRFYLKTGKKTELKEFLKNKSCSGESCQTYVLKKYCAAGNKIQISDNDTACTTVKEVIDENDKCSYKFITNATKKNILMDFILIGKKEVFIILKDNNDKIAINNSYSNYENNIYFYEKDSNFNTFSSDFINTHTNEKKCPVVYFLYAKNNLVSGPYNWYTTLDESKIQDTTYQKSVNGENEGIKTNLNTGDKLNLINGEINYLDCASLFAGESSKKLLELLHTVVTIIKISIPLLLLGLGSLDFSKAVFAGSEDNMKKAQSKFIKRVIISVCIFLIPSVLKLILTIANSVWGNISPDFCGIL